MMINQWSVRIIVTVEQISPPSYHHLSLCSKYLSDSFAMPFMYDVRSPIQTPKDDECSNKVRLQRRGDTHVLCKISFIIIHHICRLLLQKIFIFKSYFAEYCKISKIIIAHLFHFGATNFSIFRSKSTLRVKTKNRSRN